ncbi:MAG TPA: preprotein translocase subunit SecG [Caulobacterales bacterium]|nr:preprotein translocase subunit SecG [Caulobacterales bacterium]
MINVILALHLMVAVVLVGMVLLQRSEGGALGMGGGGGSMISGRGAANVLARGTGILGAVFFITSISLTLLAGGARGPKSVVDASTSSPLAPITEMFDRLTKANVKPGPAPAPAPAAILQPPAVAAPAVPPAGEVVPAPDSVVQRAAPLPEIPPAPATAAAPKPIGPAPAAATKPIGPAPASSVLPATPAAGLAPKPSTSPGAFVAAVKPTVRPSAQIAPPASLTSVKPTESNEPQIPAEKPKGRAGPDE